MDRCTGAVHDTHTHTHLFQYCGCCVYYNTKFSRTPTMSTTPADSEFLTDGFQKKIGFSTRVCVHTHLYQRQCVHSQACVYTAV